MNLPDPASARVMALWRCIACGNMGRLADCTGGCDFRPANVVEGQAYADLFEAGERAQSLLSGARALLEALARVGDDGSAMKAFYAMAQDEARAWLRAAGEPAAADVTEDRPAVWVCATCGQVEAPQECLGVCVRPVREFVDARDYDALALAAAATLARTRRVRTLLSALAHTRAREGQWDRAARHFSTQARSLIAAEDSAPGA